MLVEGRDGPVVMAAEAGLAVAGLAGGCGRPWLAAAGWAAVVAGCGRRWPSCGRPWQAVAGHGRLERAGNSFSARCWCSSSTAMLVQHHLGGGVGGFLVLAGGVVVASRAMSGFSWLRRHGCSGLLS
jgi:hypothetical protein